MRRGTWFGISMLTIVASPMFSATARAAVFAVNTTIDEVDVAPGDGDCKSTPSSLCTLRAAVMEANALAGLDEINIPIVGTVALTRSGAGEDGAVNGDLDITEDVTINGDTYQTTTVDGRKLDRVFDIKPGASVTLTRMRIINGNEPSANGGGIANDGGLNVQETMIERNSADTGGGIYVGPLGTLLMSSSIVRNNTATGGNGGGITYAGTFLQTYQVVISKNKAANYGGGIFSTGTTPQFIYASITGNKAAPLAQGGGIFDSSGNAVVISSVISGNDGGNAGGGISWAGGQLSGVTIEKNKATSGGGIFGGSTASIDGSTIVSNKSDNGGGIWNGFGPLTIRNSVIALNKATTAGGGLYNDTGASATLINVTMADNSAPAASAVRASGAVLTQARNSIIKSNLPGNCDVVLTTMGNNLDSDTSCGLNINATNPLLGKWLYSYKGLESVLQPKVYGRVLTLKQGSPAIDAGDNATCASDDWRVANRPVDGDGDGTADCDLGAYEVGGYY